MANSKNCCSSPSRYDEIDGYLFVPDEDLNITYDRTPSKSPCRSPYQNAIIPGVMSALATVISNENLAVMSIAKTMMKGAAATALIGGLPGIAMGALIAGGIYAYKTIKNGSIKEILKSLSPSQQRQLIMRLRRGLTTLGTQDLARAILNRTDIKEAALNILSDFLEEKYCLRIVKS